MSNFNKIVTNLQQSLSNTENDNLSQTLSAVRTAGGGGGGGTSYGGDGIYIEIVGNNTITLTTTAAEKLNRAIPTKVTELTDSADYATTAYVNGVTGSIYYTSILGLSDALSAKQDKLTFGYDENDAISSINSHKLAGQGGVTGDYYSASNPSGFINSAQAETQILEKHYLTEASGNARYIPIPAGLSDNQYYAYTTSSWKVIQGAGDVSGISTVAHDDTLTGNGNNENLGVDITKIQTKLTDAQIQNIADVTTLKTASSTWDNVSAKLNTSDFNTYTATTAPATYQPKGDYLSSNALEGYATTALLDTISSKIESDIPSIAGLATKTDLQNVSAGVDYVSGALTGYQITGDYIVTGDILTATNNKLTGIKIGNTNYTIPTTDLTNYYTKDQTSGATQLSTEFGKYLTTAQYNTDSATFALKSDLNGLVNSASVTTNDNYVMTNTGWKVLTLPGGGMTQVYHDTTLTGDGNANDNQLGVKWETLSSNTIAYSNSAFNLTNGTSVSSFDQISAAIDDRYSKTACNNRFLQKSLDNTLTGDGTNDKKLGVAWSALSGNTINSALSADSATSALSADKAESATSAKWLREGSVHVSAGDVTALQHWASSNSSTWDSVSAKLTTAQYATDSATFVTSSNASISAGGEQYALTTTGWAKIQGGGSTVTIDTTNNEIKDGTSAVSAMSYVVNPNNAYWKPQRSCVCTEAEISTMAGYANGQGMLFFVVSGHNQ